MAVMLSHSTLIVLRRNSGRLCFLRKIGKSSVSEHACAPILVPLLLAPIVWVPNRYSLWRDCESVGLAVHYRGLCQELGTSRNRGWSRGRRLAIRAERFESDPAASALMFAVSFFLKRNELGKGGNVDSLDLGRSACHMPMNFARQAGAAVVLVALKLSLGVGGGGGDRFNHGSLRSSRAASQKSRSIYKRRMARPFRKPKGQATRKLPSALALDYQRTYISIPTMTLPGWIGVRWVDDHACGSGRAGGGPVAVAEILCRQHVPAGGQGGCEGRYLYAGSVASGQPNGRAERLRRSTVKGVIELHAAARERHRADLRHTGNDGRDAR